MTKVTVNILLTLIYFQCVQETYPENKPETHCREICAEIVSPNCTKCFEVQLDNLKQWKRRRRVSNAFRIHKAERHKRNSLSSVESADVSATQDVRDLVNKFKRQWPLDSWRKCLFTDDYVLLINRHWLRFTPPPEAVNYALGGLYVVLMVIGCSGNGLVLFLYYRCRTLRTPGNILVANLAVSDFFMLAKTPVFIFNSFHFGPALGKTGCMIYGFMGGLTGCTSIATLAAIALDRYWAIVRPLEPLRALTAVRARILAIAAWVYAGIFASIPALDIGYGRYVPEGYLTSCSFDYLTEELPPRYFIFVFFCAAWVAPFCTIVFCYTNILRVVIYQRNISTTKSDHRLSSRHVKEQAKHKAEIKLATLVISVIGLFFVSWTPYAVVALLGIFGKKDLITPTLSMIPALFCKTTACINPFVYIITHPKFRKEIMKMLCKKKNRKFSTMNKTIGYTTCHRPSKDSSETDVEVVQMRDIPFAEVESAMGRGEMRSVSRRVAERQDSQRSFSMKSFEEEVVPPPSWFTKPQFVKKKSFHRRSTKSTVSYDTDPSAT